MFKKLNIDSYNHFSYLLIKGKDLKEREEIIEYLSSVFGIKSKPFVSKHLLLDRFKENHLFRIDINFYKKEMKACLDYFNLKSYDKCSEPMNMSFIFDFITFKRTFDVDHIIEEIEKDLNLLETLFNDN